MRNSSIRHRVQFYNFTTERSVQFWRNNSAGCISAVYDHFYSFADSAAKTHERGTGDVVTQQSVEKMLPRLRELMGDRGNLMFLAGDSEEFDSVMEREFPGRVLRVQKLELKNVGRNPSESALMRAVIELHLLSLCNHLVVTPNSRFSTVAVGLNTNCRSVDYFN